jgi:hypothetical protein
MLWIRWTVLCGGREGRNGGSWLHSCDFLSARCSRHEGDEDEDEERNGGSRWIGFDERPRTSQIGILFISCVLFGRGCLLGGGCSCTEVDDRYLYQAIAAPITRHVVRVIAFLVVSDDDTITANRCANTR